MSSEKKWFLLYNNQYHLGPFDSKTIEFKLSRGELTLDDLIWSEDMEDWDSISNVFAKGISNKPKVKTKDEAKPKKEEKESYKIEYNEDTEDIKIDEEIIVQDIEADLDQDLPPELPIEITDNFAIEIDEIPDFPFESEVEFSQKIKPQEDLKKVRNNSSEFSKDKENKKSSTFLRISLVLVFIFLVISYYLFNNIFSGDNHLTLSQSKLFYLSTFKEKKIFEFKTLIDKNKFYISTNRLKQGNIQIELNSRKNELLSVSPISFSAKVQINNYMGYVNSIKFKEGIKIIPGFYNIKLKIIDENFIYKFFNSLDEIKNYYEFKQLVYFGSEKKFIHILEKFNETKKKELLSPLYEKELLITTLVNLINDFKKQLKISLQIKKYKKSRSRISYKIRRKKFLTDYYNKSIGPMLTSLVVKNYHSKDHLIIKNIVNQGKQFGSLAVDIINSSVKRNFKSKSFVHIVKMNSLKNNLLNNKKIITQKINDYKKLFKQ